MLVKNVCLNNICTMDRKEFEEDDDLLIPTTVLELHQEKQQQMTHLVPSCSPGPTFDVSQFDDFDLNLLPLPSLTDCVVPTSPYNSPSYQYSLDTHNTMFSPEPKLGGKVAAGYPPSPASSSLSPAPNSPYSPAGRGERRISTQSCHSVSSSLQEADNGSINLQESLMEFTQLQDRIKLEQDMLLDSNSTLSPLDSTMSYPSSNRYSISSDSHPLSPDSTHQCLDVKLEPSEVEAASSAKSNNALLKQCLSNTSFQTKYNLKPFDFGMGVTGFMSDATNTKGPAETQVKDEPDDNGHKPLKPTLSDTVKIEPMLALAADQVRKEITSTCQVLNISPNPREWTKEAVKSWLFLTFQQFSIPMSLLDLDSWNIDGQVLTNMNEADFKQRLPGRHGENLFAQFDIWRTNYNYDQSYSTPCPAYTPRNCAQQSHTYVPPPPYPDTYWSQPNAQSNDTFEDIAYVLNMMDHETQPMEHVPKQEPVQSPPPYPLTPPTPLVAPPSTESSDFGVDPMEEDEDEEEEETEVKSPTTTRTGNNIHLWQFVKELLLQPQNYGNYIHWIDRQKGIFKIVDSVKVATLWGKRKNRPAMNYDKLSRSLRQYYKKGIMKKTERSQRLVYQFCHPYQL